MFLVAASGFTTAECSMNCLLLNNLIFDIILLVVAIILSRTWCLLESLLCVRSFHIVSPKVCSFRVCKEALRLLADKLVVHILVLAMDYIVFDGDNGFVSAWTGLVVLDFDVFAVRDL